MSGMTPIVGEKGVTGWTSGPVPEGFTAVTGWRVWWLRATKPRVSYVRIVVTVFLLNMVQDVLRWLS